MFTDSDGWDRMLTGDFSGLGYRAAHIRRRKTKRGKHRAEVEERLDRMEADLRAAAAVTLPDLIKTDSEFERIISANTERTIPKGKGRHRAEKPERVHLSLDKRIFGWWLRHAS